MYCRQCGTQLSDDTLYCGKCGSKQVVTQEQMPYQAMTPAQSVPSHLVGAIIATILGFFCYILPAVAGVVAIAYATQVNSKLQQGDHSGAVDASRKAMIWTWVSIGLMLAIVVAFIIGAIIWARAGAIRQQLNL